MAELIIAADLSALGAAAGELGAAFAASDHTEMMPSLGHAGADAALADFHSASRDHRQAVSAHAATGAASLRGFVLAFHTAGE